LAAPAQRFNSGAAAADDSDSGNLFSRHGVMTFFNPLSGSLVPATPAQRARQIARSQALRKNTAAEGDRVDIEHEVESADGPPPVGDDSGGGRQGQDEPQQHPRRNAPKPEEEDDTPPRLDVTA
jgi:hypothetical protein